MYRTIHSSCSWKWPSFQPLVRLFATLTPCLYNIHASATSADKYSPSVPFSVPIYNFFTLRGRTLPIPGADNFSMSGPHTSDIFSTPPIRHLPLNAKAAKNVQIQPFTTKSLCLSLHTLLQSTKHCPISDSFAIDKIRTRSHTSSTNIF